MCVGVGVGMGWGGVGGGLVSPVTVSACLCSD